MSYNTGLVIKDMEEELGQIECSFTSPYQDQLVECALVDLAVFQIPLANVGLDVVVGTLEIGVVPVVGAVFDDLGQDGSRDIWKRHGYYISEAKHTQN